MPKDVHWQKVIDDLDNFDKRIRLAEKKKKKLVFSF